LRRQNRRLVQQLANTVAATAAAVRDEEDDEEEDLEECEPLRPAPPVPPPRPEHHGTSTSRTDQHKPPVPSRAAVNRKLNRPPPAPPARTSSVKSSSSEGGGGGGSFRSVTRLSAALSKSGSSLFDSGRESDGGFVTDGGQNNAPFRVADDGFVDGSPPVNAVLARCPSSNHKEVKRPSEVKQRSKLRSNTIPPSPSRLGTLEENSATSTAAAVTYWAGPYV